MSEQVVKRYIVPKDMAWDVETHSKAMSHEQLMVLATDYDALHAEAEARLEREQIALAHAMDAASEAERLRTELEAARGLLRVNRERLSTISAHSMTKPADWCATFKKEIQQGIQQIDAFLTATPAPEVRLGGIPVVVDESVPPGEMRLVGPGGQVMARVHHNSEHAEPVRAVLNSIGRQLPDNAPLYAEPQPGPDVRGLVESIQAAVNAVNVPVTMTPAKAEYYKAGARHIIAKVNEALAVHRQAQQGGSHEVS